MNHGARVLRTEIDLNGAADRRLRRTAHRLLAAALAVVALAACGGSAGSAGEGGSPTTTTPRWSVDVAEVDPPTMDELRDLLGEEPVGPEDEVFAASIPADVFGNGDNRPDTSRPEWADLITALCTGEAPLVPLAEANGWTTTVTGYVDARGPQGPGTLNDHLDEDRADEAAQQIASDCGTDSAAIETVGGGVHPDDIRVVVVSFTPDPSQQEEVQ